MWVFGAVLRGWTDFHPAAIHLIVIERVRTSVERAIVRYIKREVCLRQFLQPPAALTIRQPPIHDIGKFCEVGKETAILVRHEHRVISASGLWRIVNRSNGLAII